MTRLRDLVEQMEGEALVEALADFAYAGVDAPAAAPPAKGTSDWYNDTENGHELGGAGTLGELAGLVGSGALDVEVYDEVLRRRNPGLDPEQDPFQENTGAGATTADQSGATAASPA